ncbi:MFS transporter [Sphaerisporangium siamense]|uniref:Putative MFS family arabinose efflux permease n=1 Tax=Sphaerisporangium siamense TaxID=795645 RepID=A0A7W7GAK4_9ACTN|nr:MFS transporter [Sphaerisporangium siamense]MBB4701529.1 putative MFS family arabinose efflux permease [Sphaerisporangium siamense]
MSVGRSAADAAGYRWIVLGIATFAQAASGFFVQGIGAIGIFLQRDLGLSTAQLGLLLSAAQFVPLVGLLVAGVLLDRYNERWVVGVGACVVAAGLTLGSTAPGYASLLVVLLVVGAGYSSAQPGGSKSVASWFDASRRGFAMGIRQAGLPLGGALAAAVLPLLAQTYGWRATLLAGGLVALLGAVVFMTFYRTPPANAPGPASEPTRTSPTPAADHGAARGASSRRARRDAGVADSVRSQVGGRLRMLREPAMRKIMLSGTSLISVQSGVLVLTVLHLHDATKLSAGSAALVLLAAQGAGVAGRICLAAWSDRGRSGRYAIVMTCMVAVIAGMAALMTPAGQTPAAAIPLFIWLGFFGYGWYGPWVAYVAESAPPDKTGFALGLAMAVNQIAVILAPPALGLLKDLTHSFTPAWGLLSVMTAMALTVTARGRRHGSA